MRQLAVVCALFFVLLSPSVLGVTYKDDMGLLVGVATHSDGTNSPVQFCNSQKCVTLDKPNYADFGAYKHDIYDLTGQMTFSEGESVYLKILGNDRWEIATFWVMLNNRVIAHFDPTGTQALSTSSSGRQTTKDYQDVSVKLSGYTGTVEKKLQGVGIKINGAGSAGSATNTLLCRGPSEQCYTLTGVGSSADYFAPGEFVFSTLPQFFPPADFFDSELYIKGPLGDDLLIDKWFTIGQTSNPAIVYAYDYATSGIGSFCLASSSGGCLSRTPDYCDGIKNACLNDNTACADKTSGDLGKAFGKELFGKGSTFWSGYCAGDDFGEWLIGLKYTLSGDAVVGAFVPASCALQSYCSDWSYPAGCVQEGVLSDTWVCASSEWTRCTNDEAHKCQARKTSAGQLYYCNGATGRWTPDKPTDCQNGAENQPCNGDKTCNAGLACDTNYKCVPAGKQNAPCRTAAPQCDTGLTCQSNVCTTQTDGGGGGGGGTTPTTGGENQQCNADNTCNAGLTCQSGLCKPPTAPAQGGLNQPCRTGNVCDTGLSCQGNVCIQSGSTKSFTLQPGWNMFANPTTTAITVDTLRAAGCKVEKAYRLLNPKPDGKVGWDLQATTFTPGYGYYVKVTSACTVPYSGTDYSSLGPSIALGQGVHPTLNVPVGSNLIAGGGKKVSEIAGNCNLVEFTSPAFAGAKILHQPTGGTWQRLSPDADVLEIGKAYWIKVGGACTIGTAPTGGGAPSSGGGGTGGFSGTGAIRVRVVYSSGPNVNAPTPGATVVVKGGDSAAACNTDIFTETTNSDGVASKGGIGQQGYNLDKYYKVRVEKTGCQVAETSCRNDFTREGNSISVSIGLASCT